MEGEAHVSYWPDALPVTQPTRSIDHMQHPSLIPSSSITGLLRQLTLVPLCQLSNTSILLSSVMTHKGICPLQAVWLSYDRKVNMLHCLVCHKVDIYQPQISDTFA